MLGLVGSLLGSVASGVFGMMGQNSANEAAQNMSANRYQVASADMTKAGLNPAAMFGSGSAASTPPVGNAMAAPAAAAKDAASSASQMLIAQKTIDQLTEQIAKTNAETANVRAGTPGVGAASERAVMEQDAIKGIPKPVFNTLVRGGYGSEKWKQGGTAASVAGGTLAAGAPAAKEGVKFVLDPPDFSSAKRAVTDRAVKAREFDKSDSERAAAKRAEWLRWLRGKPANSTTIFKQ